MAASPAKGWVIKDLLVVFVILVAGVRWSLESSAREVIIYHKPLLALLPTVSARSAAGDLDAGILTFKFQLLTICLSFLFFHDLQSLKSPFSLLTTQSSLSCPPVSFILLAASNGGEQRCREELVSKIHWFLRTECKGLQKSENVLTDHSKVLHLWYCIAVYILEANSEWWMLKKKKTLWKAM